MTKLLFSAIVLASVFATTAHATSIPFTKAEVVKLIVIENGHQTVTYEGFGSRVIGDWYTGSLFSDGNDDLNKDGKLYHRILDDAKCTQQGVTVTCSVTIVAQEFVPSDKD